MAGVHHHWGLAPYEVVHRLQERLVLARAAGRIPNVLLTGEHPAVVTLGRKTPREGPRPQGLPVVEVERGGEATYHGPGQLVAYPIIHLTQARKNLHVFQHELEEIGIRTLADFGIAAFRKEPWTGVWTERGKIQSLGIAVRRWVTWHGLALNVNTDLAPFRTFRPCGLDGAVMTSMAEVLSRPVPFLDVRDALVAHCDEILPGGPFESGPLPDLEAPAPPADPGRTSAAEGAP